MDSLKIDNKINFASKAGVVEYLRNQKELVELKDGSFTYRGVYELRHGETDKPDFKPTRYKNGWGIKKIHYYLPSTHNRPEDGRCAKLFDNSLDYELLDNM